MTPKDPFLEGTFWDKFWRPIRSRVLLPIRSRALLFTPEVSWGQQIQQSAGMDIQQIP